MRSCAFCDRRFADNALLMARVGTTVAFDTVHRRVWAVCRGCGCWNLVDAGDAGHAALLLELEHRFGTMPGHASSGGVTLTRVGRSLTLIRLGAADRGTFAFWRYGARFRGRRMRWWLVTLALAVAAWRVVPDASAGVFALAGLVLVARLTWGSARTLFVLPGAGGSRLALSERHVLRARVEAGEGWWLLAVPHRGGEAVLTGDKAERALGQLLTYFNDAAGTRAAVEEALVLVGRCRRPDAASRLMNPALARACRGALGGLGRVQRLALEIALHEDAEVHDAHGEVAALPEAVREAVKRAEILETLQ